MNTQAPAPQLLNSERLAEIRAHQDLPRHSDPYVTDYGVAADVVEELLDHIEASRLQVAEHLRGLLAECTPDTEQMRLMGIAGPYARHQRRGFQTASEKHLGRIRATAKALGIEL